MKRLFLIHKIALYSCSYIYHRLLGHEVEMQTVRNTLPRRFGAPGLPELNASQVWLVGPVILAKLSEGSRITITCFVYLRMKTAV